jgi:16S rRNA (guanine966-N2)-methyltransferase
MRIIGGTLGGRKLNPPAKIPARPTTDLAKEGLFNILMT